MTPINETPTILIIDDTPSNLSVVVNLFEDRGYRVAIAQDGEEGMQRAQLVQPNLILLDVMMPGIDGFEACRRLKEKPETRDIPVIFMTALASADHKVKGFQAGAVDYVTKPLQIDEVMARVETHLKLHAAQKRLAEQNLQLEKHGEELERRVEERTAELAAREREFRTLAENLPDNLARYDAQCRIVYMNPNLEAMLGKTPAMLRGKTPQESASSFYAEYQARLAETIASGDPGEIELVLPGKGEGVRYHHVRFVAERDGGGEIVGALAIGRDITERKHAERELLLLNRAVNASSEAVFLMNAQGRFVYVNEEACRSLGYSRAELLGMTPLDIDADLTVEALQGMLDSIVAGSLNTTPMESRHRSRDGRIFPVEIVGSPLMLEGQSYGLAMVRDITERKHAERELFQLNSAVNASTEAAFLMNAQGRFVYVNEEACRSLGYSRDELLGMTPLDIDPDITAESFGELMDLLFSEGMVRTPMESHHRTRDGRIFPVEIAASPLKLEDGYYCLTMVRDISERKEAERILHEQQQAIRAAVENSPDAYARYDRQLRRIYVNPATERLLGKPAAEIIGKTLGESSPTVDNFSVILNSVFESGEELRIELPFRWSNGERGWGDVRIVPEFDAEGRVVSVLAIGRDITERKRAEELLQEERGLFVGGPTVVFKWKAQPGWPVEYVSPNVHEQFGYASSQFADGEILFGAIVHPGDIERVAAEVASYTAQGRSSYEQEYRIAHADGSYRWIYDFTIVSRNADGAVDHYHGYVMDITDRKNAEHALQESEQRYRLVFENSPVSIWEEDFSAVKATFDQLRQAGVSDLEAHFDRNPIVLGQCANLARIVDVNLAALVLHEARSKEELFAGLLDTFTPESFDTFRRELVALWNGVSSMQSEAVVKTLAGERRYVTVHFTVCPGYEDTLARILVSLTDITERKLAEEALRESREQLRGLTAQREEAREEERKYIAREVHDELGQILTGLQLSVSVLEHKFAAGVPQLREQLEETRKLTDRSLEVARNVASALRPAALEMGILSALEWLIGRFAKNTGIACSIHNSDGDLAMGEKSAIALFRIVQESLTNVSRHAQADQVLIELSREEGDYVLKVRDNGKGFDASRKKMDSFGLVGIRERALMLGGRVAIDSQPGKGTQITVRIPVQIEGERS